MGIEGRGQRGAGSGEDRNDAAELHHPSTEKKGDDKKANMSHTSLSQAANNIYLDTSHTNPTPTSYPHQSTFVCARSRAESSNARACNAFLPVHVVTRDRSAKAWSVYPMVRVTQYAMKSRANKSMHNW